MMNPEPISVILPRVLERIVSENLAQQLADAFHRYQLALADRSYWHGDTKMLQDVKARCDTAFAECVRLTHQIREGM